MRVQAIIGLEVHVQLATATKLFCACPQVRDARPNEAICEVCTGQPGALPSPNEQAVRLAVRAGLVLGCRVRRIGRFDRKSYLYPDLPKGYQISQFDLPILYEGSLALPPERGGRDVEIERAHLEEDAGKTLHPEGESVSLVDYNRAGVPLLEIVTRPQLRSPQEARAWLERLRHRLRWYGVSECDMEHGSLRCDANVSIEVDGRAGERVEIKNLNSFRFVEAALAHEIERQRDLVAAGGAVVRETRAFVEASCSTRRLRGKEEEADYRYFPDPDLPDVEVPEDWIEEERAALPPSPEETERRLLERGLGKEEVKALVGERANAEFFERASARAERAADRLVSSLVVGAVLRRANERGVGVGDLTIGPEQVALVADRVAEGRLSRQAALKVLRACDESGEEPDEVVRRLDLEQITDERELAPHVEAALEARPQAVGDVRAGKTKAIDALVGEVMKRTKGRADPVAVRELIERRIAGGST